MSNVLPLVKIFLKSLKMSRSTKKKTRILFAVLLLITLFFIIIPFLFLTGIFVYDTTLRLAEIEYESIGLQLICFLVSLFTVIFSIPVLINEFYFSNDIEKVLPLPVKPVEILFAKFITCFIIENVIQVMVLLVSILSYILALHIPFSHVALSILPILTLPILPMIYSSLFCIIVMYFVRFIRNKEHIKRLSSLFIIGLFILFYLMISTLKNFNFELYLENFANGNHKFLDIMGIVFPHISYFTDTLTSGSILSLGIYIGINILFILGFYFFARIFYYEGMIEFTNKRIGKKKSLFAESDWKVKKPFFAYLSKEFKILVRTPTFFINCIIINFLWPIFLYALYQAGSLDFSISDIQNQLGTNTNYMKTILLILIVGISILLPAMNSVAATSFSREGKHFSFMKYIPVSYHIQWGAKFLISFLIAFVGINFYAFIFYGMIHLDILSFLEFFLLSVLAISLVSLLGVYIDSIQPKLIWDDENNALRENYNTFIAMGFAIFFFGILCGGSYFYLLEAKHLPFQSIYFINCGILLFFNLIFYLLCRKDCPKNILLQEET